MNTKTVKVEKKDNTMAYALIALATIAILATLACVVFCPNLY